MQTRYTAGNIALLASGLCVCCFDGFLTGMIFGFGNISQTGFRRLAISIAQWCVALAFPAFLLAFRWCRPSKVALWCLTGSCALFALLGGLIGAFFMPIVLLGATSALVSAIDSNSIRTTPPS